MEFTYHAKYMHQSLLLAQKAADEGEIPVGALVVHNNKIIGKGYNQVEMLKDPTAHAEMLAISAACATIETKYLLDCTLYVTLEPCPMCAGAIVHSKLKRLVFGATDDKAGGCGSIFNIVENKRLNHQVEVVQGVLEADCSALLKSFFKKLRTD